MDKTERRSFSKNEKRKMLEKTNFKCAHCGKQLDIDTMTVEHIFPIYKGGTNEEFNTTALCKKCNQEKNNLVYRVSDYYGHILPEYKTDYIMKNHELVEKYSKNTDKVFKFDAKTYSFIPNKYKVMIYNMKLRGAKRNKILDTARKVSVNLKLERAYEGDAHDIFELVKYISEHNEICRGGNLDMCNNEMKILNAIKYGDAYVLRSQDKICGAFLFTNADDYSLNVMQLKNIEEATKLRIKYVMTFGYVDVFAQEVYEEIMGDIFVQLVTNGVIPIYFNILDKMFIGDSDNIKLLYRLNEVDGTLEFFTIKGIRDSLKDYLQPSFDIQKIDKEEQDKIIDKYIYGNDEQE